MTQFGVLKRVNLRDVWPKEATDFTPWLASNLAALGEALGMDLELLQQEAPCGDFSLDILARDLNRNRTVVIENQLEPTNHDHLVKLLTYAAGHNATVVVWIAQEIREEHRQALDWLNQHTDEDLEFFGVIVDVLQIDESRPAYTFRRVAFPNEWRKGVVSSVASPRAEAYRLFFQRLIDELREQHKFTGVRVAQPQSWCSFASGHSSFSYGFSFARGGKIRVDLYIDSGDASQNKELFDRLAGQREKIEREYGETLEWERLDDRRACRIAIYRPGRVDDINTHDELLKWATEQLLKFKRVFGPRLSDLDSRRQEESRPLPGGTVGSLS
jgi:predicted TIM-barrel fold metal-dependent hydrolase